jgi:hypothetical protein
MAELRLEDIIGFFVAGGILLLIGLACVLLYVLWPQIRLFVGAFWARHFNGDWWADTLEWIADQRDGVRDYEPGIMSYDDGSELARPGSSTGSVGLVPGQQNQAAPELVLNFDAIVDYLSRHKLDTPERVVDVLAVLQFGEGHVLSANKIRDIAGGNEAAVKARVASRRPKAEAPKPAKRLERPVNGW